MNDFAKMIIVNIDIAWFNLFVVVVVFLAGLWTVNQNCNGNHCISHNTMI